MSIFIFQVKLFSLKMLLLLIKKILFKACGMSVPIGKKSMIEVGPAPI